MVTMLTSTIQKEYLSSITQLCQVGHNTSKAKAMSILSSAICEKHALHLLSIRDNTMEKVRFDKYYNEKHETAKRKLIDRLKTELSKAGREPHFFISSEENNDYGRFDLTIINGRQLRIQNKKGKKIVVEIKASLGIDFTQVERYLLNGDPLLIVRIITQQVKLLSPQELSSYLNESLRDLKAKAERILNGSPFLVPSYDCYRCPDTKCSYNKNKRGKRRIVSMSQQEFDEDLDTYFRNLYPTIDKAIQIILEELEVKAPIPFSEEVELPTSSRQGSLQSQPHHSHGKGTENHESSLKG